MDDHALEALAQQVGASLDRYGRKLASAESCTGGWLAKLLTDIPGSSAWFERGYVTYSNTAKQEALGVSAQTLSAHGAVSEQTVTEMARGVRVASRADIGVAITGIAGPGGGSDEKPLGLVWLAFATRAGVHAMQRQFSGSRDAVRRQAVAAALQGVLDVLNA